MTDATINLPESKRRVQPEWIVDVIFKPRVAFAKISKLNRNVWFTPIMILTLTALILVLVAGPIKRNAVVSGEVTLPPDYEWWTPEQQAQFQQASQSTQGPVFIYVFPALVAVGKVWLGWLIVGGLLHLVLTLLGGRGNTGAVMNVVAWGALPFVIRDAVRIIALLSTHQMIASPGLSGFVAVEEGNQAMLFLAKFLAMVDIYIIWHALLMVLGVKASNGLSAGKAFAGVLITLLVVLGVTALLGSLSGLLSNLTITRTFFF